VRNKDLFSGTRMTMLTAWGGKQVMVTPMSRLSADRSWRSRLDLGKLGQPRNLDSVSFDDMHRWIRQVYERGGINTISWHVDNPTSRKGAWDKTAAVKDILPGGPGHDYFMLQLDEVAKFLNACE